MNPRFPATNKNGKLSIHGKEQFQLWLSTMPEEIDVVVMKKRKPSRSNQQNKSLWGITYAVISQETGYTPEEVHDFCRAKFLSTWEEINGEEIQRIKSTTELNTQEFEDYQSKIRQWASMKLSIYIPLPNEVIQEG